MADDANLDGPELEPAGDTGSGSQQQSQAKGGWSLRQIPVWQQYLVFIPTFMIPLLQGLASEFLYDFLDSFGQNLTDETTGAWHWLAVDGLLYGFTVYAIAIVLGVFSVWALVSIQVPGRTMPQFLIRAVPVFFVPFILVLVFTENVNLREDLDAANARIVSLSERIVDLERQLEEAGQPIYFGEAISGGDEVLPDEGSELQ